VMMTTGGAAGGQAATAATVTQGGATVVGVGGVSNTVPVTSTLGGTSSGGFRSSLTGGDTALSTTATGGSGTGGAKSSSATGSASAGGSSCGPRGGTSGIGGFGDDLAAIPMACLSDKDCTVGICFDGPSAQTRSCRLACDTASVGQQGSCATGQVCTYASGAQKAACLDLCTPFQSPSTCRTGDWCYPAPHASFTAGVSVAGLCLAAAEYPEGERCPGGGCGLDLLCVSPTLVAFDTYYCQRACDRDAAAGHPGACSPGETCFTAADGGSYCAALCDPFSQSSQCPESHWCYPFHASTSGVPEVQGRCVLPGKHPLGANCNLGECAAGLKCAQEPAPSHDGQLTCRPICNPKTPNSCQSGETCIPDRTSGKPLASGTCQKSCQLWQSEPCAAGCASNEWCAPSNLDPGFGYCEAAGSQTAGAACSLSKACAPGNVCLCQFKNSCALDGLCERACDRSAAGLDPVHCLANEVCAAEPVAGGWSAFGICRGSCDYDAKVPCADPTEICVPGELLLDGRDTCLDVPKSNPCSLNTFPGAPCGSTALCTDESMFLNCTNVCRVSVGAIGTNNHPDCPNPSDVCSELSPGLGYGKCKK
jgi:hypothetical protein